MKNNKANIFERSWRDLWCPNENALFLFLLAAFIAAMVFCWIGGNIAIHFGTQWYFPVYGCFMGLFLTLSLFGVLNRMLLCARKKKIEQCIKYWLEAIIVALASGMELFPAIKYAANFMYHFEPAFTNEINSFFTDVHMFSDETTAWEHLRLRIPDERFNHIINLLIATRNSGGDVLQALTDLANLMQTETLVAIEEKARKIEVRMSMLLMFCFLLPLIIPLLVPQISNIYHMMSNVSLPNKSISMNLGGQ